MKKRLLSLLLALVMLVGMIPATSLTAFAVKDAYVTSVTGIEVTGDGYYFNQDTNNYHLSVGDVSMISGTSKLDPDTCGFNSIYTDESCTTRLKTKPKLDETYYFDVSVFKDDTTNNITNSNSKIKFGGFYDGKVISTETTNNGFFYCVCSITYGELTGGVKAVASGVAYDSAKGGYAPTFTTLKAVSTEGKELEPVTIPSGDYEYSYYGVRVGPLYKTNETTSFSDMLTTEPQDGKTYYSYFRLDSIDGNLNIKKDLVDIRIPGYEVEYLASYERDMGFTSLVVYSVTKKASEVYVGGVGMNDGDYLAVGATKTQTTKPSGGYAYYKNGTLTLNNYSYEGKGYKYDSRNYYATVYANQDLTVELVGTNSLKQTENASEAIFIGDSNSLTFNGIGSLNATGTANGIYATGTLTFNGSVSLNATGTDNGIYSHDTLTVNGGTIVSTGGLGGIYCHLHDIKINGGNVTASGKYGGLWSLYGYVEILGGNVTATSIEQAIKYSTGFTVAEGMKIQASTTVGGTLGEYVAANHDSYKKIVITPPDVYVGGVGMNDGDYLAVGATKTQTTKPSGGYAYYKNGKLTLNNYRYEGKGYKYRGYFYAVIYSKIDLTLELIGNNTLTQTYSSSDMINVNGGKLTVGGDGKLTGTSGSFALYADYGITINGGTIEVSTYSACISTYGGDVIINGGDITAESDTLDAIFSNYDITINGGNVTAIGGRKAIGCGSSKIFSVADSMKIQASTTVDGELGEYVAANNNSYKKITIHSHNFGTAWKYKEADGHAHVCSFCGEHDTVIKHTPNISAPTETQDQKCTACGYVIAPSLGHIHKNNLTKVAAKPASCTLDGNSEYYSCSCGKYFKDASASAEIKDKNSVIIKASHSFGTDWGYQDENGHAHACVCGAHDELIPHTPGAEATETTPQKCTECAYIITPALNHVHNLTKISAKPATCTEEGNAEFYICDGCSDWFEDAEGNVKIEDKASVKLIATGHAFGDEFKKDENEHWYECACGEKKDVSAHNDENNDGKCDACGYSSAGAETEPAVTESNPSETTAPDKADGENKGGMPWWAILLIVVAVAGISVGVTVIVLKKKK